MKYWTIQKKEIIKIVNEEGVFQPDFRKSDYLQRYSKPLYLELEKLYDMVLTAFNKINGTNLPKLPGTIS